MERGLVTTIIPVYNRTGMLREAVDSVLGQTYRPIEILIVDDASTDDTPQFADQLAAEHPEIRVLHQRVNAGPAVAREAARQVARGEFIQHLDSDDLLLPHKFELQVAGLNAHPECGASYGFTRVQYDGVAEPKPAKRTGERIDTILPAMLKERWWDTGTPLYRASVLAKAGPWTDLRNEEDWEYDVRIGALGVRLHFCEDWIVLTRRHSGERASGRMNAATMRNRARAHELILRHAQRAGITRDAFEMQHYARELFLLARQAGAVGLPAESKRLFALAREASLQPNARQFQLYGATARIIGWRAMGKFSDLLDRFR